jgi:iron-sulfur cluster insertion protein
MLTITEAANEQIKEILLGEQSKYVRAFVEGGGCSGFNYGFMLEDEKNEDDFELSEQLIVDAMSMQYLTGATIDYKVELMGANFVVNNPNAKSTCGCGSSFSV